VKIPPTRIVAYSLVRPGMLGLFERLNPGQDVSDAAAGEV
jgi:hypothetical protein